MSRHLRRSVDVQCDERGVPLFIAFGRASLPVCEVVDDWREWFGAAFGEGERDVWIVDTSRGIYELHHIGFASEGQQGHIEGHWVIERTED